MEMIGKVRRLHHRQSKSVREIARITSLSRNTVRKCLRDPVQGEPKYRRAVRAVKLTPFHEAMKQALNADAHRPKRERRTALALYGEIRAAGYAGGYTRVTDFIREWRQGEVGLHGDLLRGGVDVPPTDACRAPAGDTRVRSEVTPIASPDPRCSASVWSTSAAVGRVEPVQHLGAKDGHAPLIGRRHMNKKLLSAADGAEPIAGIVIATSVGIGTAEFGTDRGSTEMRVRLARGSGHRCLPRFPPPRMSGLRRSGRIDSWIGRAHRARHLEKTAP